MTLDKNDMLGAGLELVNTFCRANDLTTPAVLITRDAREWRVSACAYYRPGKIAICVPRCAHVGSGGMAWSFPGYVIDRTPYGVLAHELGHHVDLESGHTRGKYWSDYGEAVRCWSGEKPITNYCSDDAEWFAEVFRLFVTNPDLLKRLRPRAYACLSEEFKPVERRSWREVLASAPKRTISMAAKKISGSAK